MCFSSITLVHASQKQGLPHLSLNPDMEKMGTRNISGNQSLLKIVYWTEQLEFKAAAE